MPAILIGASRCNEQIWQALKTHIIRERQRKKQEQEADEEEERLRKERERQQKQDVMTFGETREQIINLQNEILKLQEEKHDLFAELKRVVYEEGGRKRQLKENSMCSEVLTIGGYSAVNTKVIHLQQLSTVQSTNPLYESSVTDSQISTTSSSKKTFSPPSIPSTLSTLYPISYCKPSSINHYYSNYKPLLLSKSKEAEKSHSCTRECVSRDALFHRIIEKKFSMDDRNYSYSSNIPQSSRGTQESSKPTYPTGSRASLATHQPAYVSNIHLMEQHKGTYDQENHYLRSNQSTVHGIPIQQSSQGAKTGGISTGFPIRSSAAFPCQPSHSPAVTNDDMSHITLSRLLSNQPSFEIPRR